jgi:glycosyltransferase involved in cell wall biosynthesis
MGLLSKSPIKKNRKEPESTMKVVIVLPAYNVEEQVGTVIDGIRAVMFGCDYGIVVVNDCSSDATSRIAEEMDVKVINHATNKGYGSTLMTGFNAALKMHADIVITMDADGQHNPLGLASLIEPIGSAKADVVVGSRFLNGQSGCPLYRELGIRFFTAMTHLLFGVKVSDCQSGLRAYRAEVIKNIRLQDHDMGISLETLIRIRKEQYLIGEVPIVCNYANVRHSKNPISHGASLLKSLVVCYFEKWR